MLAINLSRREREILDILYRLQEAAVEQVRIELTGNPQYSTVRALLRVLEEKGHVVHQEQRLRYVYRPVVPKHEAAQSALRQLRETFFASSTEEMLKMLLQQISSEELDRVGCALEKIRKRNPEQRLPA